MKWISILALLFSVSCSHTQQNNNKKLSLLYLRLGTAYIIKKNYPSALKELLKSLKLNSNNYETHNNIAIVYLARNKVARAETHFRESLRLNPLFTEARNNLAKMYLPQERIREAIQLLRIAEKDLTYKAPENTHYNLGRVYLKIKKYKLAKKHFQKSLSFRPEQCHAYKNIGKIYYLEGQYKDSLKYFLKIQKLCPLAERVEIAYYRGLNLLKLKRIKTATLEFNNVITKWPDGKYAKRAKQMLGILRKNSHERNW